MAIHHLSCGTMCPRGARFFGRPGGTLGRFEIICHCLLIETGNSLVLVDSGLGSEDMRDLSRLGPARLMLNPQPDPAETAQAGIGALGLDPGDVGHVIATHLDLDHAGGLPDFPDAQVHVTSAELRAATDPGIRERERYRKPHFAHGPKWVTHDGGGDSWFGFESVRVLPGVDPEIALIPLPGHSRGHTAVAVNTGAGWLLHCGDAYFFHGEVQTPPHCPPGWRAFQNAVGFERRKRLHNQERLRELARDHGDEVDLICAHDPLDLSRLQA